ncbi:B12-binding domain-containing radical SAM protein [Paenibacillus sp. URB8-2]|uniref:B12-binding domain-containing radical SAM protein n=1 Tax=Paenibacillus sp. URB8-2 TaxID=2741301 RepID=UPI0015BFA749|nr:radical SAM protein [Paenibacillus sp. URB8-2]BCG57785.1 B12-binding domain-containing radical SAM protein [Paenibacillus sp. URB8-2]
MRKKILLIQPENEKINRFRRKQFNNFVQITMPYLAGFIDESKYQITLVDEYRQRIPFRQSFDLVAITVNTPNAYHCYQIAEKFRAKGAKVVMGGPHVTLLPEEASRHCDSVLIGEAEETWPEFLEDFHLGKERAVYRSEGIPDLKNLPLPRWDLLKRNGLMKGAVFATRGCPYRCAYCNLKQIYHDRFRVRPIPEVIREISLMKSKFFVFWDDNFFADKAHAIELMESLKPLGKKWAAQVTLADCNDDELLKRAREAGCLYLFVGLESFSPSALRGVNKGINRVHSYRDIVGKLHKHRIMIQAGIVFGFDEDTPATFGHTLEACEELGIDGVTVSLLTPLPRTPVYAGMKEQRRLLNEDWSMYNGKTDVVFNPRNMTSEQLFEGYLNFRRRFYSLPSFIRRMKVSRTHLFYNFIMNLGYRLALKR